MSKKEDLHNLCYSFLIDQCGDAETITEKDARHTMNEWREEGDDEIIEIIEGVTPQYFAKVWNDVYYELNGGAREIYHRAMIRGLQENGMM